jgi:CheY-like chemotaxis protein
LVERILGGREEYTLLAATTGRDGLRVAREQRPDLVLLDLHLPDINGDAVLERLRSSPETRAIPVLMLSADATPAQVERLLELGATDYMTKPLDIDEFLQTLERICSTNGR